MPEPTEGPWVAAPVIKGFPQHPGEVRGPNGPVACISLAVPIEQRHATVSVLAAGLEMLEKLIEIHAYFIDQFGESEGTEEIAALIAKPESTEGHRWTA